MKDEKTQSQIAQLLNRHKSTTSQELARNTSNRGYRPKASLLFSEERSLGCRNAVQINPKDWDIAVTSLYKSGVKNNRRQVGIRHETIIYRRICAGKASGGNLYQQPRCQMNAKSAILVAMTVGPNCGQKADQRAPSQDSS